MNHEIAIVTDTNSGLSTEEAEKMGVSLIPMPVIIDGTTYYENLSIGQEDFFRLLGQGAEVSTSQPPLGMLMKRWKELLQDHESIIYLPMSSGLSGSCGAAKMLAKEYGGRVYVVDNHRISVTLRQSVLEARHLALQGKPAEEIVDYLSQDGPESSIYIAVNTLELLKRSGRVTAAGAVVSAILGIKPVLQIQGGKLDAYKKVRGMKYAMEAMIAGLKQDRDCRFAGQKLMIRAAYSGNPENGELWRETLQAAFPELNIGIDPLPLSIACHTGDGALGVGMTKDIL